jgi:predicted ATPase
LVGLWGDAERGHGRVALVSGEPGIGKSRLALALQHRLRRTPHMRLRLSGSPYHGNSPLHPVIEYLDRAAGHGDAAGDKARRERLGALLSPVSPTEEEFRLLAGLLAIPLPAARSAPQDSAERTKEKTFEAVLRHIEALARREPLLIVVEDAQWIDPTSRELLERAAERVARLRALLLVMARPEFQPGWREWPHVRGIVLDRFGRKEAVELVRHVAGSAELPAEMLAEIIGHAEGVPLYIEELTRGALEAGEAPVRGDAAMSKTELPTRLSVPGAVCASLISRFDRLGRTALEVAQVASVLGREFSSDMVHHVFCWSDAAALESSLRDLGGAGLVFRRQPDRQELYAFKHALIQDAVYSTLLLSRRKQLHAKVVSCLEERYPEVARREPDFLAPHCTLAGLTGAAVDYWLRAGRQAIGKSALVEAIAHLQNGLRLLPLLPESDQRLAKELGLQTAMGRALMATRGFCDPATGEAFARARKLCQLVGDNAPLFTIHWGQFMCCLSVCDSNGAQATAVEARQLGMRTGNAMVAFAGDVLMGIPQLHRGNFAVTLDHWRAALATYDAEENRRFTQEFGTNFGALLFSYQAWALLATGQLDEAHEFDQDATSWHDCFLPCPHRRVSSPLVVVFPKCCTIVPQLRRRSDRCWLSVLSKSIRSGWLLL